MRRMCVSIEEATPAGKQHQKPCDDCPWRRDSLPGWLGGSSVEDWLVIAHSDEKIDCHTRLGAQCAGAAIYRRNICKSPRDKTALTLPADRDAVFASPSEFQNHHENEASGFIPGPERSPG